MNMGKKYMSVVIIEHSDYSKVPSEIRKGIFASETGNTIPKGFVADMGGEEVIRYFSYAQLKGKDWYKNFIEISKQEKQKPDFGSLAHLVTKEAKVTTYNKEVMSFKFGSPVKTMLSQFTLKAQKDDDKAKEAKAIVQVVNDWGQKEFREIEKLKTKEPTKAYMKMEVLNKTFLGLPLAESLPKQISDYKKDKYFVYLLGLRKQYERLMAAEKKNANTARYLSKKIEDFAGKVKDETLKSEAQLMVSELSKI